MIKNNKVAINIIKDYIEFLRKAIENKETQNLIEYYYNKIDGMTSMAYYTEQIDKETFESLNKKRYDIYDEYLINKNKFV